MTRARRELYLTSARDYGGTRERKVEPVRAGGARSARRTPPGLSKPTRWRRSSVAAPAADVPMPALPPLGPDDELIVSHKQIDDYQTCPLKYKYVNILRLPIRRHHAVAFGAIVHKAVEYYLLRRAVGNYTPLEESAQRLRAGVGGGGHPPRPSGQPRAGRGLPQPRARGSAQGGRPRGPQALLAPGGGGRGQAHAGWRRSSASRWGPIACVAGTTGWTRTCWAR